MTPAVRRAARIEPLSETSRPATVVNGDEVLWLVGQGGTMTACTVRGSSLVDQVQGEVIHCTRSRIDE